MTNFDQIRAEREINRWMRSDAHRLLRPDWRRFWKPGHENEALYRTYERIERKYSPDQPRDDRGRWTDDSGSSNSHSSIADAGQFTRIAARISPGRQAECDEQYRHDTFTCNIMRTASCWRQMGFRYGQCLIGGYIPPIYH